LLKIIKKFFNDVGTINVSDNLVYYKVRYVKDLSTIISHFNKYPLCTSKIINFVIFTKVYDLIGQKYHTNVKGFLELAFAVRPW